MIWFDLIWYSLVWYYNEFIHEEISMLFHLEKFLGSGGGGWHCNYSYKLQVQVS